MHGERVLVSNNHSVKGGVHPGQVKKLITEQSEIIFYQINWCHIYTTRDIVNIFAFIKSKGKTEIVVQLCGKNIYCINMSKYKDYISLAPNQT